MLGRLWGVCVFMLRNLGPLIAFLAVNRGFGLLAAIAAAMAIAVIEVAILIARRKAPTRLFVLTTVLTLGFGGVDLWLRRAMLFRFEAVITNLLTACFFGATLLSGKPILLEFYEKSRRPDDPFPPEAPAYARVLTAVWTVYFFAKTAVYGWISWVFPLDRAVAIRAVVGGLGFLLLFGGELMFRQPLFSWMKERGWIAAPRAERT